MENILNNPVNLFIILAILLGIITRIYSGICPIDQLVCEIMCMVSIAGILGIISPLLPITTWVIVISVLSIRSLSLVN